MPSIGNKSFPMASAMAIISPRYGVMPSQNSRAILSLAHGILPKVASCGCRPRRFASVFHGNLLAESSGPFGGVIWQWSSSCVNYCEWLDRAPSFVRRPVQLLLSEAKVEDVQA